MKKKPVDKNQSARNTMRSFHLKAGGSPTLDRQHTLEEIAESPRENENFGDTFSTKNLGKYNSGDKSMQDIRQSTTVLKQGLNLIPMNSVQEQSDPPEIQNGRRESLNDFFKDLPQKPSLTGFKRSSTVKRQHWETLEKIMPQNNPQIKALIKLDNLTHKSATVAKPDKKKTRTTEFLQDIDNFVGIKKIENYFISSICDDGFGFGPVSVGVLQLFNKHEDKNITKEDTIRLSHITNFLGALSVKVNYICTAMTLIIGLTQDVYKSSEMLQDIESHPGTGVMENLQMPVDTMKKQIISEATTRESG